MPVQITGLAHVNLNVTDLQRAEKFYTEILGCKVSGKYEEIIVWLNFGQYEADDRKLAMHDLALYKVPHEVPPEYRKTVGLNHVAFRLATPEDVDQAAEILKENGVKILKGPETHKEDLDHYVYFEDPDRNVIELVSSTGDGYKIKTS